MPATFETPVTVCDDDTDNSSAYVRVFVDWRLCIAIIVHLIRIIATAIFHSYFHFHSRGFVTRECEIFDKVVFLRFYNQRTQLSISEINQPEVAPNIETRPVFDLVLLVCRRPLSRVRHQ